MRQQNGLKVPATFHNDKYKPRTNIHMIYQKFMKATNKFGSGAKDYIPQRGWGGFSKSPGLNRAGNAIPCRESADWLYTNRSSPRFPLQRPQKNKFGKQYKESIVPNSTRSFYNPQRKRPNTIYGPPTKSYSPYTGSRTGGILPRPYGPIDNASIKGYPNGRLNFGSTEFGAGPFVNQAYNGFGAGPFVNQAYNGFGNEFKPHSRRTWKPQKTSWANQNLYEPGWNPFELYPRTPTQQNIARNAKRVNQRFASPNNFGLLPWQKNLKRESRQRQRFGDLNYGPNRVAYEQPFHMYPWGVGANTTNFITNKQYLPPCKQQRDILKVQPNNNPNGYLSGYHTLPVSGTKFGKQTNFKHFTTELVGTNEGASAGFTRIAQPAELYTYQNKNYGSYNYPEFLGPRAWMGGFGASKTKKKKKKKSTTKPKPGDTLYVKNGKIKVKRKKK
jgi:hypothetical protein